MMGNGYGYGFGFGGLWMILFLVLIVAVVVLIARGAGGARWSPPAGKEAHHQSAMQILEERYARGEVNREEYLQIKRDLETNDSDKPT
jgi:putative membrane protein